jgi:hypothetical protein
MADGSGTHLPTHFQTRRRDRRSCAEGEIMPRHRSKKEARALPRGLARLIHAAKTSGTDAEGSDISTVPDALRELGELALWALPIHGAFVANNNDIDALITKIAGEHLGLKKARLEFSDALDAIEIFRRRDAIESAHNHIHTISDAAYYYAGLAFGITLTDGS